ncbi:E3 ubiquitin-protein ligase TRIM47-like isoform 2-T2 [Pholidichthys leucotaenia]
MTCGAVSSLNIPTFITDLHYNSELLLICFVFPEMASSSSLFSKDNFLCPICLSVFTQPVSTPCGHNFCMSCISTYWNDTQPCWCPVCKEYFERRPYLKVNTFISELVPQLMRLQVASAPNQSAQQQQVSSDNEVLCNICTDTQKQAVKSCLECLTSYCDVHLEPHHRAAGLKRHTLVEPTADVEDHICKEHNKLLVLFCRDDSMLLCDFCVSSGHTLHSVAPVKQAHEEMKDLLEKTQDKVQRMVEERMQKVDDLMGSLEETKTKSADLIGSSPLGLTEVVSEIQKELLRAVMETQTKAEEEADVFIRSMQQEIVELKMANMKLRDLKEIKNAISFLQSYPRPFTLPHTMDLSTFRMNRHLDIKHVHQVVRKSVSQLRELLNKLNTEICKLSDGADVTKEIELRYAQQYEVNIVLDPDTAHPMLVLSDDRKQLELPGKQHKPTSQLQAVSSTHCSLSSQHSRSRHFRQPLLNTGWNILLPLPGRPFLQNLGAWTQLNWP